MTEKYLYGTVRTRSRSLIYALRVPADHNDPDEVDHLAALMREKVQSRGEIAADVVVVQGASKETLRLYGTPYSVNQVRAAMFNAALSWKPIDLS